MLAREVEPLTSHCFISPSNTSIKNSLQYFCVAWPASQQQGRGRAVIEVRPSCPDGERACPGAARAPRHTWAGDPTPSHPIPVRTTCLCRAGMCVGGTGDPGEVGMQGGQWVCKVGTGCCHGITELFRFGKTSKIIKSSC